MISPRNRTRRGAFSLAELMVVLSVGTIVAAITVGGFKTVSEGNRKTSCQANLAQIYLASKQYSQDFDGRFPYLNGGAAPAYNDPKSPRSGFGLWTLYAFTPSSPAAASEKDQNCEPLASFDHTNDPFPEPESSVGSLTGYARALKIFHCPSDHFSDDVKYSTDNCATAAKTIKLTSGEPIFTVDKGLATEKKLINPLFMSYQGADGLSGEATYSVFRTSYSAGDPNRGRQLQPFRNIPAAGSNPATTQIIRRTPEATTVMTWCRFHRSLKNRNETNTGKRNYDNVLFYDGSVQFIPEIQNVDNATACTAQGQATPCTFTGWQRLPKSVTR